MKTFSLFFVLLASFQFLHAAILTVNNNNPSPGQFSTIEAAYTASSPGDTLYIHGSPIAYGSFFNINLHPVTIIGTGFNPANASSLRSMISGMQVNASSSGTVLIGLTFNANLSSSGGAANIIVDRCAFPNSSVIIQGNNWEVSRCYFGPLHTNSPQSPIISSTTNPTNALFFNNIFIAGNFFTTSHIFGGAFTNITFLNNLFIHTGASNVVIPFRGGTDDPLLNASFHSNIFIGINPLVDCSGCTYDHNLSFAPPQISGTAPELNTPNNSTNNIVGDPLFTAYPNTTILNDYNLLNPALFNPTLQATSPAMTAGFNGVQIGPFGGLSPFEIAGETDLPIVRQFTFFSPIVPAGTNLPVNFTATPNN